MTIYSIHFMLLLVYAVLYSLLPHSKASKLIFITLAFGQTFLLYALRSKYIGTDTWAMATSYASSDFIKISEYMGVKAPLYYLLRDIFHFLIPMEQGYMILCGIFIVGGTAYYIYRNSKDVILSAFLFFSLYFFFFAMNGARQSIAMVLAANGLVFIVENRKFPAIVLMMMALFIHSTAIILIPFLSLLFVHSSQYRRAFMFGYCVALMTFSPLIFLFTSLFPIYDSLYISSGSLYYVGKNRKVLLTLFYLFLFIVSWVSYYKLKRHLTQAEHKQWEFYLCCLGCAVIIGFLALKSLLLTRMEYYFSFTLILFIPLVLSKFKANNKPVLYILAYVVLAIPGIFQFIMNYGQIRPYLFFWE